MGRHFSYASHTNLYHLTKGKGDGGHVPCPFSEKGAWLFQEKRGKEIFLRQKVSRGKRGTRETLESSESHHGGGLKKASRRFVIIPGGKGRAGVVSS